MQPALLLLTKKKTGDLPTAGCLPVGGSTLRGLYTSSQTHTPGCSPSSGKPGKFPPSAFSLSPPRAVWGTSLGRGGVNRSLSRRAKETQSFKSWAGQRESAGVGFGF